MTLGTPSTLPNFKCKRSQSEIVYPKSFWVSIDNKHDFKEHLHTVCEKANPKLHALNRISRFLSQE